MRVVLKVRFGASSKKFEKFSNNNYLVYVPLKQNEGNSGVLAGIISKRLGVPAGRIKFAGLDINKN